MERKILSLKFSDAEFPKLLKEIPAPPQEIFVLGKLPNQNEIAVSIVGTRKATSAGQALAYKVAKELSELGIIIISGLAMGIDSSSHRGALHSKGKTLAVLANGLDKIYPAQNENLAQEILKSDGALISEYPPNTPAYPNHFLERNRIISGLSIATIVIEAPNQSGSLATARHALEQGREVLVFPGPADHPNYSGSHKLIRMGARLVSSVEDILEDLGLEHLKKTTPSLKDLTQKFSLDKTHLLILETLIKSAEPLSIDKICELTKLSSQTINQLIASLVIEGIIKETEKGYSI